MMRRAKVAKTLASRAAHARGLASQPKIVWTYTDEAPALATFALLPVVQRFCAPAGLAVETSDISVAGRIISHFPERLKESQRQPDELAELGELAKTPDANIIKLPNVSASIPQLEGAIAELQQKGYDLPNFPASPSSAEEKEIAAKYAKVLGSAVNPVLREGNSDRRVAGPVKAYAQKRPHRLGKWDPASKTHVAHMTDGDFFSSEQSHIVSSATSVRIELNGEVLKAETKLEAGEVIDSSRMSVSKLRGFFEECLTKANSTNLMVSLHLKATMMKISDPIMFGHAVEVFFKDAFAKHGPALTAAGANPNNGLGAVYDSINGMASPAREEVQAAFAAAAATRPPLAYVDSNKGITNLHVPSDVIIDASMPAMIRGMDGLGGGMWTPDSKPGAKDSHLADTMALVPDRSYAGVFYEVVEYCKKHGAFDPKTLGIESPASPPAAAPPPAQAQAQQGSAPAPSSPNSPMVR